MIKGTIKDIKKDDKLVVTFELIEDGTVVREKKVSYPLDTEESVIKKQLEHMVERRRGLKGRIEKGEKRQELDKKAVKTVENLSGLVIN